MAHFWLMPICLLVSGAASALSRRFWPGLAAGALCMGIFLFLFATRWISTWLPLFLVLWSLMTVMGAGTGWFLRAGRVRAAVLSGLWALFTFEAFFLYTLAGRETLADVWIGLTIVLGTVALGAITVFALPRDGRGQSS